MSSCYGEKIKVSVFGQSHGQAIGVTIDGIPAGEAVDLVKLKNFTHIIHSHINFVNYLFKNI